MKSKLAISLLFLLTFFNVKGDQLMIVSPQNAERAAAYLNTQKEVVSPSFPRISSGRFESAVFTECSREFPISGEQSIPHL